MAEHETVVVGAGLAGLSAALTLKDVGVEPLVIDRADAVGSAWRGRYERLRLNTWGRWSHLPDRPYPKEARKFPTRDQVIEHLDRHVAEAGLDLRLGTAVERVEEEDLGWRLQTSDGDVTARQVIVATGYENEPLVPDWPGREDFRGEFLHSADYRNPAPFAGKRVLVVGPGCSGTEIAFDLAENGAAKVWLSARTPPNIVLREGPGGLPGDAIGVALLRAPVGLANRIVNFARRMDVGDLTEYGLPVPEEGVYSRIRRSGQAPAVVDKEVIEAIKDGRIEIVRGVESLAPGSVELADGARVEPDAVICATGYRRGLEPLVGHLGVLDERGMPRALAPEPAAPGLRFQGYVARPGAIGFAAKQAKRTAKAIRRELDAVPI